MTYANVTTEIHLSGIVKKKKKKKEVLGLK